MNASPPGFSDLLGQRGAEIARVLAPAADAQLAEHAGVDAVHAAGNRLQSSTAAGDQRASLAIDVVVGEETHDCVAAELELVGHAGEARQLLLLVVDRLASQALLAAIDRQLRGGRPGVYRDRPATLHRLFHVWASPASTTESAIV